jgi:hypothetical protein
MDQLAHRLGARINLVVLRSGNLLFVEWVESTTPLRVDINPATSMPVHCTASGKLLLAFGPRELRENLLRSAPFASRTKNSITSARALNRELAEIRRRGYAEDNEELLQGVNCLAVPVYNLAGEVVAGWRPWPPSQAFRLKAATVLAGAAGWRRAFLKTSGQLPRCCGTGQTVAPCPPSSHRVFHLTADSHPRQSGIACRQAIARDEEGYGLRSFDDQSRTRSGTMASAAGAFAAERSAQGLATLAASGLRLLRGLSSFSSGISFQQPVWSAPPCAHSIASALQILEQLTTNACGWICTCRSSA